MTGSYDPDLNLTYWGTGNPGPDFNVSQRPGDNLYSDSVVALDADTGKLKWYFQYTPNDAYDYDSVQVPVLVDMDWKDKNGQSKPRKMMFWANRNGLFYGIDRSSGEFLLGKPFVEVNWMKGFDEKGRPMRTPAGPAVIVPGPERRIVDLEAHRPAEALARSARRIGKCSSFHGMSALNPSRQMI